jgi:hypothetical protein
MGILVALWAAAVLVPTATVPAAPASAVMLALLRKVLLFRLAIFDIVVSILCDLDSSRLILDDRRY